MRTSRMAIESRARSTQMAHRRLAPMAAFRLALLGSRRWQIDRQAGSVEEGMHRHSRIHPDEAGQ